MSEEIIIVDVSASETMLLEVSDAEPIYAELTDAEPIYAELVEAEPIYAELIEAETFIIDMAPETIIVEVMEFSSMLPYPSPESLIHLGISNNNCCNRWLHYEGTPSNKSGFVAPVDSILTHVSISTHNVCSGTFYIRKAGEREPDGSGDLVPIGDAYSDLIAIDFTESHTESASGLGIAINAGDAISAYWSAAAPEVADFPNIVLTLQM